jgi:hypothetical protein
MRPVPYRLNAPRRSNCLIWAVHRRVTRGGHLTVRRSVGTVIPCPHVLWYRHPQWQWGYSPDLAGVIGRYLWCGVFSGSLVFERLA